MRLGRIALVAVLMASVGLVAGSRAQSPAGTAQQPPERPSFRSNVNAVQVDLRVVDRGGHFIEDLKKDEFRVYENGQEQAITTFALVNIPIEKPTSVAVRRTVDADVATNVRPQEGRLFVIVLDDLDVEDPSAQPTLGRMQKTPQRALRSPVVRALATEFIEKNLSDIDQAALITTSGRLDIAQEFTNNRQRLLAAVNRYEGGYGQMMTTPGRGGMSHDVPGGVPVSDNLRSTMLSLTALARWLAQIDGRRKSMILISDRLGRTMTGGIDLELATGEAADARDFVQAAARGNVTLYTIDPIGAPGSAAPGIRPITPDLDEADALDNDRRQSLVTLAEATGGFSSTYSNKFTDAFERIVVENSSYYLLGYAPANVARDGKFRNISVKTTRPGLRVLARSGYVAASDAPVKPVDAGALPPAISALLRSPVSVSGLQLRVTAPPFRGSDSKASVAVIVEAGANQLQFAEADSLFSGNMTLAITAADKGGNVKAGEQGTLRLQLSPGTRDLVLDRGARVVSRLDLKPGHYHLRIAALDERQGTTRGDVVYDMDVPDFSKGPLTMSGIALASLLEAPVPTVGPDKRWMQLLGAYPTAEREFTSFNQLREYVEVYDNDTRGHQIAVTTTVRNQSGTQVFQRRDTLTREAKTNDVKTITHRIATTIHLNDFTPGHYVLSVEARNPLAAGSSVLREVPFAVR